MKRKKILKLLHLLSTLWFILMVAFIVIKELLDVGTSWWFIVSLSGYSALLVFILTSFYLFALYRNVAGNQKNITEHPFTTSYYYYSFYDSVPFIGAFGGLIAAAGNIDFPQSLMFVALGTFWSTFVVWIIFDPFAGLAEMALPQSRKNRKLRIKLAKQQKHKRISDQKKLLQSIQRDHIGETALWEKLFKDDIDSLCAMIGKFESQGFYKDPIAVDIGLKAWRTGNLDCMNWLNDSAVKTYQKIYDKPFLKSAISVLWDGIGNWRSQWLEENTIED